MPEVQGSVRRLGGTYDRGSMVVIRPDNWKLENSPSSETSLGWDQFVQVVEA